MCRDKEGMSKHFFLAEFWSSVNIFIWLAKALSVKFEKSHDLPTRFKVTCA